MTVLALDIGPAEFAASRVSGGVGTGDIKRIPAPANAVWEGCRDLLLDVAGDDEITAVGIACPGPIDRSAGRYVVATGRSEQIPEPKSASTHLYLSPGVMHIAVDLSETDGLQ
ncbi:hypothetical protein ACQP2U_18045 [Nocardia sp. CA-084685]|uniref:hypothetical protein n=1 Tax=Nocardia sp. CA-084685 TaxID=3239970 RepID=UPI003D967993